VRIVQRVAEVWRNLFDIRPGEYRRTIFMSLYLLFVLFAYYVLKSASEAMFLNKFDIDKLPNLYILMAIFGGGLAFVL
jgi:ATP/ADP translocase